VRKAAILIAASPTRAFYSQIAALCLCLRRLQWSSWRFSVHVYLGGQQDRTAYAEWLPHLEDVKFVWASHDEFARHGDWAQSDDVFRHAPRDVDLLLTMDADTLPVRGFESLLDDIHDSGAIGGVVAHYPFPSTTCVRDAWERVSHGLVDAPLTFDHAHTLMPAEVPDALRRTPFY
jgi:hypothetical protein